MEIDLQGVPFSRNGSYLVFSFLPASGDWPAGLYLRSVHGGAQQAGDGGRVALVEPARAGRALPFETAACPAQLDLLTERGALHLCLAEPYVLRVRGEGVGLRLTFDAARGDLALTAGQGRWRINSPAHLLQWMLSPLEGGWTVRPPAGPSGRLVAELRAADDGGACEAAVEEFTSAWRPRGYEETFEDCVELVETDYTQWLAQMPKLPERYAPARRLAAYLTWSALVEPAGHFMRPALYQSKNQLASVSGWDHCFNAMALVYRKPIAAWDQMMTVFDQQDDLGALPESCDDRGLRWNFCKPPIHGWALGWMMDRTRAIRSDQLRQIYGPLCRWTEWWFRYRDDDRDGIPQYHHANDSGWGRATPFLTGAPLEAPDLSAFLVLQMDTLARMAARLRNTEEAEAWQRRADELLKNLLAHCWQGDHFVALRSGDHLVADGESLFLYLPLLLGKRLPPGVWRALVTGLLRPERFLTAHGLATESPASRLYQPDIAWRGPICAPATLMMADGLTACGERKTAADLAGRFCDMVAAGGFAERFDALSGAPLGDRASAWTAAAFTILGHEYLLAQE